MRRAVPAVFAIAAAALVATSGPLRTMLGESDVQETRLTAEAPEAEIRVRARVPPLFGGSDHFDFLLNATATNDAPETSAVVAVWLEPAEPPLDAGTTEAPIDAAPGLPPNAMREALPPGAVGGFRSFTSDALGLVRVRLRLEAGSGPVTVRWVVQAYAQVAGDPPDEARLIVEPEED